MDLLKSIFITLFIFAVIGFCGYYFYSKDLENNLDESLAKAEDLLNNKKYSRALTLLEDRVLTKNNEKYLMLKSKTLLGLHRVSEAELTMDKLLKVAPDNDKYHFKRAMLAYNFGNYDLAVKLLIKAIELQPKNTDYKLNLARLYTHKNELQKSITMYEKIMKEDPKYQVAWAEAANIYEQRKDYKNAYKYRKDAVKRFNYRSYDQYHYGIVCEKLNKKAEAINAYKRAIDIEPNAPIDAKKRIAKLTGKTYKGYSPYKEDYIPVKRQNNLMITTARANGVSGKFLLDTGASSSVLYKNYVDKNHMDTYADTYGTFYMANGEKEVAQVGYADFKIGNHTIHSVRVAVVEAKSAQDTDGIIGMNCLENYNIHFDRDKKNLIISR